MNITPVREINKGPIINWIADKVNAFGCWMIEITAPYALYYRIDLNEHPIDPRDGKPARICLNSFDGVCDNYAGGLDSQFCDECFKEEYND